jgi:hypothetical protein
MTKVNAEQYRAELDDALEAGDWLEGDDGLADLSEAERLAHAAESPRLRKDGEHRGSDIRRPKPLSPRQVLFCQGVIQGKSLRTAYRDAYANDTGSDASISASANKLMKDPRIKKVLEDAWEETAEHLSEDLAASKRYVLKGLLALSKGAKQEGTKLKALELMGKAAGLFTPTDVQDKAVITAEQLKRELAGHIKLLDNAKASVLDVDAKSLTRLNDSTTEEAVPHEGRVNVG